MKEMMINGEKWILDSKQKPEVAGLTYCVVRTFSAGIWAGFVDINKIDKKMEVRNARRLWRWWSEFTLSALAVKGVKKGKENENKYAMPVDVVYLTEVIEVIPTSDQAEKQIQAIPNYEEK